MKAGIHPQTHNATISCTGCGFSFETLSTKQGYTIEVCSKCHPFITGEQRFIDTKGRVQLFEEKQKQAEKYKEMRAKKKKTDKKQKESKSLKELLGSL